MTNKKNKIGFFLSVVLCARCRDEIINQHSHLTLEQIQ